MKNRKNLYIGTVILIILIPFFSISILKKIQTFALTDEGKYKNIKTFSEAERSIVQEIDKIFEKGLEKTKSLTLEKVESEGDCQFVNEEGKIVEHVPSNNSRTDCVAENALEEIRKFRERTISLVRETEISEVEGEGRPLIDVYNSISDRNKRLNDSLENLEISLDMAIERYDIIRSKYINHLQFEKQFENLESLNKEIKKLKDETNCILNNKVIDASSTFGMGKACI